MNLLALTFGACSLAAAPREAEELCSRLVAATAWVRTTTEGVGTGWVVDRQRRWLVTCLHVVGDRERIEAIFPIRRGQAWVTEREYYIQNQWKLHEQGAAVWGKVILRREQADLALVELASLPDGVLELPLAASPPEIGVRVHSVGQRHDAEALWVYSVGAVRQSGRLSRGYFWHGKQLAADAPGVVVQSPVNTGDSGSALVGDDGSVIGVLSAVRWQTASAGIAIQSSEVAALLADARKKPSVPPAKSPARKGLPDRVALATGWVRPAATDARAAGWVLDRSRRLLVTSARATGSSDKIDVVFPRIEHGRLACEEGTYRDLLGLRLSGDLVRGLVLCRDLKRDLALVECVSLPERTCELRIADDDPSPAARVQTIGHPTGAEWLWLYAEGAVRQDARVHLGLTDREKDTSEQPLTLLLQLPPQGGSGGGAVVNDRGEVVGSLSGKDAAQQQISYAVAGSEIRSFLNANKALWAPATAAERRQRARFLIRHGCHKLALEAIRPDVSSKVDSSETATLLAEISLAARDFKKARELAEEAVRREPNKSSGRLLLAAILIESGDPSAAVKCCDEALRLEPKNAIAFARRGEARRRLGQMTEALRDLDEALWLDPACAVAFWYRGQLHEAAGELDKALLDLARAAELEPALVDAIRRRAVIFLGKKEWKKAAGECERLLELAPMDAPGYVLLGRAWLGFGDEGKALIAYSSSARLGDSGLHAFAADALRYGEQLAKRLPGDTGRLADWFRRVIESLRLVERKDVQDRVNEALKAGAAEKDVQKQLAVYQRTVEMLRSESPK